MIRINRFTKKSFLPLFTAFVFLLTGCENFLKSEDVKQDIVNTIEYNNAPSYVINVETIDQDKCGKVKTPATGEISKKVTDVFPIRFEPSEGYVFKKWEAVVEGMSTGEKAADYIEFEDSETGELTKYENLTVLLTDDEIELSKKYDAYIRDTIAIFGDLKMIDCCRSGNPTTHQSAMDCKYEVAARNGWSADMDKTIEINQQIDAMYNPNALTERVNTVFQITHLRKKLLTDNKAKLPMIKSIIEKEPDKRYLIVSSTGDFCNTIMKYLIDNGFNCTGYHNDLEDAYLTDSNGQIICYKSGEFKGQPKVFKAAALSSNNLLGYNSGYYNILCIKSSCKPDIETDADVIIFTTPLVDNIFAFRQRFQNVSIPNPTIIHRIYCTNTNEETTITKEVASSLVNLHDDIDEKSIMIDEKSGDIIL